MDRFPSGRRWLHLAVVMLCAASLSLSGCSMLATLAYVIQPNDVKAAYPGLVGKRVAVVCRPVEELHYANANVAQDLAKLVGIKLTKNVKKIEVIDQNEVSQWTDENNWTDYAQIGRALDADMVVAIDLEQFSLNEGPTLYRGSAQINLAVYDVKNKKQQVYHRGMPRAVYPPNTGIPTSDKNEAEFRYQYLEVLSEQVGRHFYDHNARDDFASDSKILN
jgi:hypothetical protein